MTKGQVTVFIILGIVILGIFSAFYFLRGEQTIDTPGVFWQDAIRRFTETCMKNTAEEGIYFLGLQGGYFDPENDVTFFSFDTPIYLAPNQENVPDLKDIEEGLNYYIQENLVHCTNNYRTFEEQGIIVEDSLAVPETRILPGRILVDLHYPLKIYDGPTVTEINEFTTNSYIDFHSFFEDIIKAVSEMKSSPDDIPLGSLMNLAYNDGFQLETDNLGRELVQYTFLFDSGEDEPYVFNYAVQYDWPEGMFLIE
jgi:hypothetical protein